MALITFQNPQNGYTENYNTKTAPLWCFLFGPIYWLVRKNIPHALISLVCAIFTFGISHLIYPFFANKINLKAYGHKGWVQADSEHVEIAAENSKPDTTSNINSKSIEYSEKMFGGSQYFSKNDKGLYEVDEKYRPKLNWKWVLFMLAAGTFIAALKIVISPPSGEGSVLYQTMQ